MHCPDCGHSNDAEARFCGECGTAMPQSPQSPPPPPPVSASPPVSRESSWQPVGGGPEGGSPGAGPRGAAPVVSNGLKWGVAAGSLLLPILGLVMGIIYIVDANPAKKSVGKLWLWTGIAAILFWCGIGAIGGFMEGLAG